MITFGLQLGNSIFTGMTFFVDESRSDNINFLISNLNSTNLQYITMTMQNEDEQHVIIGTISENTLLATTLSIICLADKETDISTEFGKFFGVKSVEVELLV